LFYHIECFLVGIKVEIELKYGGNKLEIFELKYS